MLKALNYCHKVTKVIHRDIKPANIVINHNNEAVLIDFGVSAIVDQQDDDTLDHVTGSYLYYAPEMFSRGADKKIKVRGEQTDVWALGITLFYMISGRTPFDTAKNAMALKDMIVDGEINYNLVAFEPVRTLLKKIL
jgi:serine/threonine protein kinase